MYTIEGRIAHLRTVYRLTQSQLAEKLGVSEELLGKWETGEKKPSLEEVLKLSDFFKVSVDYLTKGIVRDGDNKVINRKPTQEELLEDFEKLFPQFIEKYELTPFRQQLLDMLPEKAKIAFASGKKKCYNSMGQMIEIWSTNEILSLNNFHLYQALEENGYIARVRLDADLLKRNNITDIGFYEKCNYDFDSVLLHFIYGEREWNDEIILTVIKRGGCVLDYNPGRECWDKKNILSTKLMASLCEQNIKQGKEK
jgi:transcriptional regulator with XRE-family HTH domain